MLTLPRHTHGALVFFGLFFLTVPLPGRTQCINYQDFIHLTGSSEVFNTTRGIAMDSSYAYVGSFTGGGGVRIVDITDPANPTVTATANTGTSIWDIALLGNHIYATSLSKVYSIDISAPFSPAILDTFVLPNFSKGLAAEGNLVLVAEEAFGLRILDSTDPANLKELGNVPISGGPQGVAVGGNMAYVTATGLHVVDVSNPNAPSVVGFAAAASGDDLAVDGNHVYLVEGTAGLKVFDVSIPSSPAPVGSVDTGNARDVEVAGGHAFVADDFGGFKTIDISDPTNPVVVGNVDMLWRVWGVGVTAGKACLTGLGMHVIDISGPTSPDLVGSVDTPGKALGVEVVGAYAYVADGSTGLQVVDISAPGSPSIVGSVDPPQFSARDVAVQGNYAYLADDQSGTLRIIDISKPACPFPTGGSVSMTGNAVEVEVQGDHAYVIDRTASLLHIVDVSNPVSPAIVDTVLVQQGAADVVVDGNYAYIASHNPGFQVVDISNPVNSVTVAVIPLFYATHTAAVHGDYVYLGGRFSDILTVVDVSTPSSPVVAGVLDLTTEVLGRAWDIAIDYPYAYVAFDEGEVVIIDVSDPQNPTIIGGFDCPDFSRGIALDGNHAYVAVEEAGFLVLPLQCVAATSVKPERAPTLLTLFPPSPNPTRGPVALSFEAPPVGDISLTLYDVTGRRVREWMVDSMSPGRVVLYWDGRIHNGLKAPAGIYFVHLRTADGRATRRLTLLR